MAKDVAVEPERLSTWDSIKVYGERRVFVAGLPGAGAQPDRNRRRDLAARDRLAEQP